LVFAAQQEGRSKRSAVFGSVRLDWGADSAETFDPVRIRSVVFGWRGV